MSSRRKKDIKVITSTLNPEVSGSCLPTDIFYPDGRVTRFVTDVGIFQEAKYNQLNYQKLPFDSKKIDFALITHNHADHNGRLPILMREGFSGKIYTTSTTKRLMYKSLIDDYRIMVANAKIRRLKPLYDEEDVENAILNTVECKIGETIEIDDRIKVTFLDNGHLLGATSFFVEISYDDQERGILFSGDRKSESIWKEVKRIPDWIREKPKTVVCESTYGNVDSSDIEEHFMKDVVEIINSGKSLLAFVFAQGRAQEVLYKLKELQKDGKLSRNVPICLDGNLAQENTIIYQNSDEIDESKRDFLPDNFYFANKENRMNLILGTKQRIILTTSGMGDHGPAQIYIPALIGRKDFAFYFTGYVSKDSSAYEILHPTNGMAQFKRVNYIVNADVYTTAEFSAHSKADQLLEFLRDCGNVQCVLLNHGETETQKIFGQRIIDEGICDQVESLSSHTVVINEYGIVKIMGSKFYIVQKPKEETVNKAHARRKWLNLKVCRG